MKATEIFEDAETPIVISPNFNHRIGFVFVIISYSCGWLYFADSYDLAIYFKRIGIRYLSRYFARQIDSFGVRLYAYIFISMGGIVLLGFWASYKYGAILLELICCFFLLYWLYALFQIAAIVVCLKVMYADRQIE